MPLKMDPRLLRLMAFLLLFALLQAAYLGSAGAGAQRWLIEGVTVPIAAALIDAMHPQLGVQAQGAELLASGGGLRILQGCEGSDIFLLWAAAMLAAPLRWPLRLWGLLFGLPLLFGLNQLRVLLLFQVFRAQRPWFELAHDLLLPLLLVAGVGAMFRFMLRLQGGRVAP